MGALQDFITGAAGSVWVYFALLAVCIVDAFFPPVPSESVIAALAAIGSSTGQPSVWLLVVAAATGAIIGDNIAYTIGAAIGTDRFAWMRKPRIEKTFAWARRLLDTRAAVLIVTARYIPVGRIAVNMVAGATKYPRRKFFPLTVVAGITWALYSVAIATLFGRWLSDQPLVAAAIGIACAVVLGFVIDRVVQHFFAAGDAQDQSESRKARHDAGREHHPDRSARVPESGHEVPDDRATGAAPGRAGARRADGPEGRHR
ncbi:DedA family protein [Rhodococcus sp. NPDC058521]|uniref:DedA family protein n=1 Tax=Rhodococcus sp. NPDC058521 TaxID=3346536 RepID=UPI003661EA82